MEIVGADIGSSNNAVMVMGTAFETKPPTLSLESRTSGGPTTRVVVYRYELKVPATSFVPSEDDAIAVHGANPEDSNFDVHVVESFLGGAEGTRTPHLIHAMDALYQMSYSPKLFNCRQSILFQVFIQDYTGMFKMSWMDKVVTSCHRLLFLIPFVKSRS